MMVALLTACSGTENGNEESLFPIKDYTELQGEEICKDEVFLKVPIHLYVINGNLFIYDHQKDSLFYRIKLNNLHDIKRLGPVGQGPHDFIRIMPMYFDGHELGVYDFGKTAYQVYQMSGDDIVLDESTFLRSVGIKTISACAEPLGDYYAINHPSDGKPITLISAQNDTIGSFGEYPGDTLGITQPSTFVMRKFYTCKANPQRNRLAVAGATSDWLAFYAMGSNGEMEKTKEYYSFETEMFFDDYGGTAFDFHRLDNTVDTFHSLYATDQHLFASCEGTAQTGTQTPYYIFQFDWEGSLQHTYLIPEPHTCFAVDESSGYIYTTATVDGQDPCLMRYKMKN